ncbi:hypothetical protein E0Z10_g7954 [Xylaria hypoxylon]|uniref:Uncharacterized protein n=1 Tax=Xylaria hypoxylon TaxID=37992 RepID=A0A4Z0YL02_9PEZI|nr:hypothetical protein E0Z10_g7954 [Xylaria hypoxylon]
MLETSLGSGGGMVGFSGTALPDADDTAKAITALHYLGRDMSVDSLLQAYEGESCFKTYPGERNSSISANCNVLICLLTRDDPMAFCVQITKILHFVSRQLILGASNEKWHCHRFYWQMLLAEAFALLHSPGKSKLLHEIFHANTLLQEEINQISLHMLIGIISTQQLDGCWDETCEVTAYAVLTLSSLLRLPLVAAQGGITRRVLKIMEAGKSYLMVHRDQWSTGRHIWIEKVTYASTILSEAYCIAAAVVPVPSSEVHDWFSESPSSSKTADRRIRGAQKIIQATQLFVSADKDILGIAEAQARYSMSYLERQRLDIFPRDNMSEDKYLTFIPLTWTTCSSINNGVVGIGVLREMMVLSMLNYQVDEFMETAVVGELAEEPDSVKSMVRQLFREIKTSLNAEKGVRGAVPSLPVKANGTEDSKLKHIKTILSRYITHILRNPTVLQSPHRIQQWLATELEKFLLAHVTQAADNHRLRSSKTSQEKNLSSPAPHEQSSLNQTFHNWVRSTSADHTSCSFSFIFYICLVANKRAGIFTTPKVAYVAEDFCCRLAGLVRMYNDYGSIKRDRMEANLNSMDFPEFAESKSEMDDLMWIAEYERRAVESALAQLRAELEAKGQNEVAMALRLFYNVADLYGLIYVQKDIATQLR